MKDINKAPSLLDRDATGGDTAEGGFRFQDHLIIGRVPAWLSSDGFTDMIREGYGDTEARFFIPQIGITREFIEYKNYDLTPVPFWEEIERFRTMDSSHEKAYWRYMLVCTGVSNTLHPMINALNRLRGAYSFYDDSLTIQDASYKSYLDTVIAQGKDEVMAKFLFKKVFINNDPQKSIEHALGSFRQELEKYFPVFKDLNNKPANDAWQALTTLVSMRRATPITRAELEDAIWIGVASDKRDKILPLHFETLNQPTNNEWALPKEIIFDWTEFSGGEGRAFPDSLIWNEKVIAQLKAAYDWVATNKRTRNIKLTGQRRLSAGIAIGSILNAVSGFNINMDVRGEIWATDSHPDTHTPPYNWTTKDVFDGKHGEVAIAIGIGRDAAPEVSAYILSALPNARLINIHSADALTTAAQVNLAVNNVKKIFSDIIAETGATKIHLFMAVPAQFALFLGHRLNATCAIQCYERISPNVYQPTCTLNQV